MLHNSQTKKKEKKVELWKQLTAFNEIQTDTERTIALQTDLFRSVSEKQDM